MKKNECLSFTFFSGIVCAEGDFWKEQRKFVSNCLRNLGMLKISSPKKDVLEERILFTVNETILVSFF